MKKRYILFLLVICFFVAIFVFITNKPRTYSLSYDMNEFKVLESFNIEDGFYSFKLTKDEYVFYYAINQKYTSRRQLVEKINTKEVDNYLCLNINVFNKTQDYICSDTKEYKDAYQVGLLKIEDQGRIKIYEDVDIYKKGTIYEWNGYGFTDITTGKKINVLKNEKYDNSLSYQFENKVVFADYDHKNEFKKFYILDMETGKISTIENEESISYNSYFEGFIGNNVYLFDKNNNVQYAINLKKKKIFKTSDKEGSVYYDGKKSSQPLKNFKYKNIIFKNDNIVNFLLKDDKLYMTYKNSDIYIKIFDKVNHIIYSNDTKCYFLVGDTIYIYEIGKGYQKVASSLEWNFHYESQIFIRI